MDITFTKAQKLLLTAFAVCPCLALAADPPAPPKPDYRCVPQLQAGAEANVWRPMFGSAPVATVVLDRPVLHLPCKFAGRQVERASWDIRVKLDLTNCQGVQFQLYCDDVAPISNFTLYAQSGGGWYAADYSLEETGRWVTIQLDKSRFHTEGNPGGWSTIRNLRFSAWRGQEIDTVLYLADFGLLNADAPIVLVGNPPRQRGQRSLPQLLQDLALPSLQVRPAELTPELLGGRQLLILCEPVDGSAASAAAEYLGAGRPVIAAGKAAGTLQGEKLVKLEAMPAAMAPLVELLAGAAPQLARQAADRFVERVGVFGSFRSTDESMRALWQAGPEAAVGIAAATTLADEARELASGGQPAAAITKAQEARRVLLEAWCSAQQPAAGEFRAFWCHEATGVAGLAWDEAIRILADNGFNAIIPNMLWGGVAYYRSEVLPVAPLVAEKGDQIEACLAACRKYGVQLHVWKVNWNMSGRSPVEFRKRMKEAGRTQVRFGGALEDNWLCPSHPENRKLEVDSMVELATKYKLDGVHFDYIRYPDADTCYCAGCRERFEKSSGSKVAEWPGDTRKEPLREKWLQFRRDNITAVVAAVAAAVHKDRPGVKVSAAVFPYWSSERDSIGQDWKLWCQRGYLDFVCPMDYRPSLTQFSNMVRLQKAWAGKVPCYPGIGESLWDHDICRLIDQIKITRQLNTGGFTVFNYAEAEAREVLPLCGKGITRK